IEERLDGRVVAQYVHSAADGSLVLRDRDADDSLATGAAACQVAMAAARHPMGWYPMPRPKCHRSVAASAPPLVSSPAQKLARFLAPPGHSHPCSLVAGGIQRSREGSR